jgi:phosphatidylglycerophosphate synthase/putative flippase GtrA
LETLWSWLQGELGPQARVVWALLPALLLAAYVLGGLAVYALKFGRRGVPGDPDVEARGTSLILGRWLRLYLPWIVRPLYRGVLKTGLPADAITTLSVLFAAAACVALAAGRFGLGGWLYIFSGVCDFLDGRIARARNQRTKTGAALDSILDRYVEGAVFGGLAWYYRDSWVLPVIFAAMIGSFMVSYVRARGEGLGVSVTVGLMARAERMVVLGPAVALSPILEVALDPTDPHPPHRLAIYALVILAVLSNATALSRLRQVLALLAGRDPSLAAPRGPLARVTRDRAAAAAATLADFVVVLVLVQDLTLGPVPATALGCLFGAMLHFPLDRRWSFRQPQPLALELRRYVFASTTSALLNASGVAVSALLDADYRVAWWGTRVLVFVAWSYPLQRTWVFAGRWDAADGEGSSD